MTVQDFDISTHTYFLILRVQAKDPVSDTTLDLGELTKKWTFRKIPQNQQPTNYTTMSSSTPTNSNANIPLWSAAAVGFVSGMVYASYAMRLRDRERLRNACSRIQKHLLPPQRMALGPVHLTARKEKETILVVGAGAYGTAMAYTCAANGHKVVMHMRDPQQCEEINTNCRNPKYLSKYPLNPNDNAITGICTRDELAKYLAIPGIIVILALPCQKTPLWIQQHADLIGEDVLLVSTAKGLYLPTQQLVGHAILDALNRASQPLCFLSGPSFAEEIVQGYPTAVVIASDQLYLANKLQRIMSNGKTFRVYTSQDPIGVQLGGALKNPLAVGAGMIAGLGYGTNTLSASVTRASRELCDLAIAMGGHPDTIDGLSGIGDLMLTCFSSQSRNQRCGTRLMKGHAVDDILKDYTVEGVPTADVAVAYADMCGLECPIFRTVHALIHKTISPEQAVVSLMGRPLNQETTRANYM
ncbi:Probable glycerol-3-phosphate dehydrogenase 2 [NAD(P)+] [Seminavis robusta]|uniref:Glycerol-3-phosphate dehydrogenase [NAD(+)] n=1 Tax=Seminavis robusta TaxID=568900 RepID=A0A9N8EQ03_9STRA|nr:Probable glycerol-3-phosphate dehydrogenase 2 [NAD(P)+] [Seminavis robusta]|eukprot:Sro1365_g266580.1 Probable glycerol-3-phosphate dehydrogenase 2 [NAD(P)+] (471) ;mRNA; r:20606-22122